MVNIGSVAALMPEALEPVYAASKAYLLALTRSMQAPLAERGVRVQVVLPGIVRTGIWERAGKDVDAFAPERVMSAEDLVDAALRGLELGETVCLPSLPDTALWDAFETARAQLLPWLSLRDPAHRYRGG